jgi:hypothetical protein
MRGMRICPETGETCPRPVTCFWECDREYERLLEEKRNTKCAACGCIRDRHYIGIDGDDVRNCPCGKCDRFKEEKSNED